MMQQPAPQSTPAGKKKCSPPKASFRDRTTQGKPKTGTSLHKTEPPTPTVAEMQKDTATKKTPSKPSKQTAAKKVVPQRPTVQGKDANSSIYYGQESVTEEDSESPDDEEALPEKGAARAVVAPSAALARRRGNYEYTNASQPVVSNTAKFQCRQVGARYGPAASTSGARPHTAPSTAPEMAASLLVSETPLGNVAYYWSGVASRQTTTIDSPDDEDSDESEEESGGLLWMWKTENLPQPPADDEWSERRMMQSLAATAALIGALTIMITAIAVLARIFDEGTWDDAFTDDTG
ncbi:hypothetical protein V5799_007475, partial [Amblyomma americanum]